MFFFGLKVASIIFLSYIPQPTPKEEHFASLNSHPISVQPEDHLASQLHSSDISMSSQKGGAKEEGTVLLLLLLCGKNISAQAQSDDLTVS